MTARGIGSRNSPIIIDDDDDNVPSPSTTKANLNSSTSPTGTTPQEPIYVDSIETHSPTPAWRSSPDQLRNGVGYSILVRMGYKPGRGLGVNLEGVTSPIKARVRPQRFPAGLGASHVVSSSNAPPQNTQKPTLAINSNRSRPAVYRRIQGPSSSLPAGATTTLPTRSFEHSSDQDNCLDLIPEKTPHDSPSGPSCPPGVDPRSSHGFQPAYVGGTSNAKTSSSFTTQRCPDSSHNVSPHEAGKTRPPLDSGDTPVSPSLRPPFHSLPPRPPHLPLPPVDYCSSPPVHPSLIGVYSNTALPIPPPQSPPTFTIPYVTRLRGKTAFLGDDTNIDTKARGMRGLFLKEIEPPPNPSCSVVMESLPRKFRTDSFILGWLSQFPFQPSRYELVQGKAFFEFATESHALLAWHSPRMGGLDGLLSVRLFWYRMPPPQPPLENTDTPQKIDAKGTIDDPARPQLQSVSDLSTGESSSEGQVLELKADRSRSHTPTHKSAPPPPPPPTSTINVEKPRATVNPQSKDINSNPDNQTAQGTSPPMHPVPTPIPVPTPMIGPLAPPTQHSDPPDCQMGADSAMAGALPPGGVPSFFPGTTVSQTLISAPLPSVSSSSLASSTTCASSAVFPIFSPGILDSSVASTPIDQQAYPISVNQELMETSSLAAEISRLEAEVAPTKFEKVYGTLPQTDDLVDVSDSETLAKEQMLRELVLQSRKRKLLQASSNQQSTSATAPTTASENALEQLAVNFIADAIARPPAKRVKITPPPSATAAWRTRLEHHIKSSKALMAKIQSARSKTERTKLMTILREKDRRLESEKMALFSCPVGDVDVPVSPWPDSHPDQGILELSDTENENYASNDDDME